MLWATSYTSDAQVFEDRPNVAKTFAGLPHQQLPVAPGEIRRRPHRPEILAPLRTLDRRADELAIGQVDAVFLRHAAQGVQRIVAHLVA
jgi:hypothetical protein